MFFLGQTPIKVECNNVKWVMKNLQKYHLTPLEVTREEKAYLIARKANFESFYKSFYVTLMETVYTRIINGCEIWFLFSEEH